MDRHGSCNCGAVRFTTRAEPREIIYCHCSQCRRQTGLYYAATNVARDALDIEGEGEITWYAASQAALRGFCRTCGSALFWRENDSAEVSIMAGAFDVPSGLKGGVHIFVSDKADFYEIADGLPQHFDGWGPKPSED